MAKSSNEDNTVAKSLDSRVPANESQNNSTPTEKNRTEGRLRPGQMNNTSKNILTELFPENGKAEDFRTHSVYLKDSHWKKIQKIAKDQNISNSAVITKILDNVL